MGLNMYFDQSDYAVRCEWGMEGLEHLAPTSDVIVIVDVFSFTTAVDIAVSRGASVYPYRWRDESAADFAETVGAKLAAASRGDPEGFSLSPRSMMKLEAGARIVLPSPNGATLSLAAGSAVTIAGCLRNASAVARAAAAYGEKITLIPAGERWESGALRPALEDWLGTGAILNALAGKQSPEAEAAAAAYRHFQARLFEVLSACGSGKEAAGRGSPEDVRLAAALDASQAVPRLENGYYSNASFARA
jgi:2-phosphosulfolactate phosphatase